MFTSMYHKETETDPAQECESSPSRKSTLSQKEKGLQLQVCQADSLPPRTVPAPKVKTPDNCWVTALFDQKPLLLPLLLRWPCSPSSPSSLVCSLSCPEARGLHRCFGSTEKEEWLKNSLNLDSGHLSSCFGDISLASHPANSPHSSFAATDKSLRLSLPYL